MSKTETNVSNLKINRGTYANIQANLSSIGEDELIITTDKNIPIPTSNDAGKVVKIDNSGEYTLGTIDLSSKQDTLTTTSVSSGTLSQAIGFDSSNNLVRGNIIASGVLPITTAPVADNTSGDYKLVILNTEPATYYNGYIYIIIPVSGYNVTLSVEGISSDVFNGGTLNIYDEQNGNLLDTLSWSSNERNEVKTATVTTTTGKLFIQSDDTGYYRINSNTVPSGITIISSQDGSWQTYTQINCLYSVTASGTITLTIDWAAE